MLTAVFRFLDRFIPESVNATDPDGQRRCRLLVACCLGLALFAIPFFAQVVREEGYTSPTALIFIVGSGLTVLNPFLLLYTGSPRLAGILFSLEVIVSLGAMACFNGGFPSASLIWNPAIPILATALVGPAWGGVCAGLLVIETVAFYLLAHVGYTFPHALPPEHELWFRAAGSSMLLVFIALLSWFYEMIRKRALNLVEEGVIALRRREARFRSLIENGSDFITILEEDGRIRYGSPSIHRILGYDPQENFGKNALEFIHPEDLPRIAELFTQLVNQPGQGPVSEFRFRHSDGSWRIFEAIGQNLLQDEAVHGVVITARDITERKAIEQLKDELVSTISHELRTPLTSLRGFTELLLSREFPREKQQELLTIMNSETARLTNMINNFLDLQRMAAGREQYTLAPVDLLPLLHDAIAVFTGASGTHRINIGSQEAIPWVRADAERIRQVLANLLSNAVKFSPNGGDITVTARRDAHEVVVSVTDRGMGIAADMIPSLFTKFHRIDNALTRRIGGTGLGLALVKEIVTAHGGRVWIESEVGKGSTFFFTLPVAEESVAA